MRQSMLRISSSGLAAGLVLLGSAMSRCEPPPAPGSVNSETPSDAEAPLLTGITVLHRQVTTHSPRAQRYFDQGLNLAYAFNHDEAIRSFREALRADPTCAMAWWGIALVNGPHINNPAMDEPRSIAAWKALHAAQENSTHVTPVEAALIHALARRYVGDVQDNIAQRESLNRAYADAMALVHQQFPDDVDVTTLYAEALMDLRPWDLWSDEGHPRPETPQVLSLLETALAQRPDHPGANHLYIHASEASPHADRALAAADRLRTLMPGSGHMVHMPAHIDVRVGHWSQAADQNERAMEVDTTYRQASPQQQFYQIYMLHNPHFLAFTCMMQGRQRRALEAARAMIASVPPEFLEQSPHLADPYLSIEYQVLLRFGQWDGLLRLPAPPKSLPITNAMWRFARATALAAQRNLPAAQHEQALFREAKQAVPADARGAINLAHDILQVGEHALAGEIAFQQGDMETAVSQLGQAIEAETRLLYMEPPEWIQPVRHSLGAVLVAARRWDEAEAVYRADLEVWPNNGWALFGLAQCLTAKGNASAAQETTDRFRSAWSRADTHIGTTCLCVPPAGH